MAVNFFYAATSVITEHLVWSTALIPTYNGREERHALATRPLQNYSYSVDLQTPLDIDTVVTSAIAHIRDRQHLIVWHAARHTPSNDWSFEFGPDGGIEVDFATGSTRLYSQSELATAPDNKIIYPIRVADIDGSIAVGSIGSSGVKDISFTSFNVPNIITPTNTELQMNLGVEVWQPSARLRPTDINITNPAEVFSSERTRYRKDTRWIQPKRRINISLRFYSENEIYQYKQFLWRRQGMFSPFYFHTLDNILILVRLSNDTITLNYHPGAVLATSNLELVEVLI